jgi:preprotein translocase subunit SecA
MQEVHEDPALASQLSDDPAFDPADPDGGGVATLPRSRTAKAAPNPNDPSLPRQGLKSLFFKDSGS